LKSPPSVDNVIYKFVRLVAFQFSPSDRAKARNYFINLKKPVEATRSIAIRTFQEKYIVIIMS